MGLKRYVREITWFVTVKGPAILYYGSAIILSRCSLWNAFIYVISNERLGEKGKRIFGGYIVLYL